MSPLLFGVAKDFRCRFLSCLVKSNVSKPVLANRLVTTPTHLLYANDILLFGQCGTSNIRAMVDTFVHYGYLLGWIVN